MFKTYRDGAETIIFRSDKKGDYPLAALNIATLFFLTVFKIALVATLFIWCVFQLSNTPLK